MLGLLIGVLVAVIVVSAAAFGLGLRRSVPVGTLIVLLFVAAFAGLLAAQLPARRAARLDVLEALASE